MDVRRFEQCVRHLAKHYRVVSLEDVFCNGVETGAGKPLASITFDDGYHDNLEYAAPILQRYKCPASFYIVTDCIDTGEMVWTQEIKHYFRTTQLLEMRAALNYLPPHLQATRWKRRKDRLAYAKSIRDHLITADQELRRHFLADMRAAFSDVAQPRLMMTWDEVRAMQAAGFVIGSHTKTHPVLTEVANQAIVEEEMMASGRRIMEELGSFPISVAYPFGACNAAVMETTKRCGYKIALTANQRWYTPGKDGAYNISRTGLSNESWLVTRARINGSYERVKRMLGR